MKTITRFFLIILSVLAYNASNATQLQAYFSYNRMYAPGQGTYIETNLQVLCKTVVLKLNAAGKLQGEVEATFIFHQGDKIATFRKITVLSPELDDTAANNITFLDQQRIPIEPGDYEFEIIIADKNSENKSFSTTEKLTIPDYGASGVTISDIQIIDSWKKAETETALTRNGLDIIPYLSDFMPENMDNLRFYCEVYNSDKIPDADGFALRYFLQVSETGKPLNTYIRIKRQKTGPVNVVLAELPINELPSGNYFLIVEVRDKNNTLITSNSIFFQRSNPSFQIKLEDLTAISIASTFVEKITDQDTLLDYIHSCWPIATSLERRFMDNQLKMADMDLMRKFMLRFWEARSEDPEATWKQYHTEVCKVQKEFGTRIKRGYETDRGRVYLQYGPPNSIAKENIDPNAYPYEIWHYYSLQNQRNKKFVFYNPDEVTNDYALLHSDAIGEINDNNWEYKLHSRNNPWGGVDQNGINQSNFGSNSSKQYSSPY
ncbi:MAG: GWxTD domain-containing protein [Bacteroidetes bacterium]|nr:GWxTD domain-containing protein [Bacteroidota bacterium]